MDYDLPRSWISDINIVMLRFKTLIYVVFQPSIFHGIFPKWNISSLLNFLAYSSLTREYFWRVGHAVVSLLFSHLYILSFGVRGHVVGLHFISWEIWGSLMDLLVFECFSSPYSGHSIRSPPHLLCVCEWQSRWFILLLTWVVVEVISSPPHTIYVWVAVEGR